MGIRTTCQSLWHQYSHLAGLHAPIVMSLTQSSGEAQPVGSGRPGWDSAPPGVRPDGAIDGPLKRQLRPARRRHPVSVRLGALQDTAPTLNPRPAPKRANAGRGLRARGRERGWACSPALLAIK